MRDTIPTHSRFNAILLALCLTLLMASSAVAQVQDDAGFFSADAVSKANQTIDRIKREHGKDLRIETYRQIPSNLQSDFQRLGKNAFYEQWAQQRGQALKLDGMLILITREPSRIQIQVGRATRERAFVQRDRDELTNILASNFKARRYDDGLTQAAEFVYRRLGENLGPESRGAAAQRGPAGGTSGGATYPPAPGGGTTSGGPGRSNPTPPVATRTGCGGSMGSMLCMIIAIVGAVVLIKNVFARRAGGGYGGQGPGMPPSAPYGGGAGYGYGGGAGGGGFGRGMLGGLLGGVLGGWAFDRFRGSHNTGASGIDTGGAAGLPPTDPSTFDTGSSGADFGGGGGGADFGGGGGGGGDSGSSGSDF